MARLIDSDVLIAVERRGGSADAFIQRLSREAAAVASITAAELLIGVHHADSSRRRLEREAFIDTSLERLPVLSFDLEAARVHAKLWAQLTSIGQMIGAHDLIIAATALANGYAVLTYNLGEFRRVPGLVVEQPGW